MTVHASQRGRPQGRAAKYRRAGQNICHARPTFHDASNDPFESSPYRQQLIIVPPLLSTPSPVNSWRLKERALYWGRCTLDLTNDWVPHRRLNIPTTGSARHLSIPSFPFTYLGAVLYPNVIPSTSVRPQPQHGTITFLFNLDTR